MNIETITYICKQMGWDYRFVNDEMIIIQHPEYIAALFVDAPDMELITFAGVVKATMAKRGWLPYYDERYGKHDHILFHRGDIESGTEFKHFDPTDPISEATAICEAAKEALMLEEG